MSTFIPNSYQTPNSYIDDYLIYFTPEEWKVLSFMTRKIFGWNKREDRISISQISLGTGMADGTCKKALHSLIDFNFVIVLGEATAHLGRLYSLQLEDSLIESSKLMIRKEEIEKENNNKTKSAREKQGVCRTSPEGVCDTSHQGGMSHIPHNIHYTKNTKQIAEEKSPLQSPVRSFDPDDPDPKPKHTKPSKLKIYDDEMVPKTESERILFGILGAELKHHRRKAPQKWPSTVCRDKFNSAVEIIGKENVSRAITNGIGRGLLTVVSLTDYISGWAKKSNQKQNEDNPIAELRKKGLVHASEIN